jgi:hypothetical protein
MRREAFLPALCLVRAGCVWAQAFDGKVTMENPNHLGQDRERDGSGGATFTEALARLISR